MSNKDNMTSSERTSSERVEAHTQRYAAQLRVTSAIEHLENARAQLDAALADLSSVIGASSDYNRIRHLSNGVIGARRRLDQGYYNSTTGMIYHQWKLDHTPKSPEAAAHGCTLVSSQTTQAGGDRRRKKAARR